MAIITVFRSCTTCVAVTVLVTMVTKPRAESELVGLVYSLTEKAHQGKAPAWYLFLDKLPTTSSQKLHKISLFAEGDPRTRAGAIDLRPLKKKQPEQGASAASSAATARLATATEATRSAS